jgi:hypothetical protein
MNLTSHWQINFNIRVISLKLTISLIEIKDKNVQITYRLESKLEMCKWCIMVCCSKICLILKLIVLYIALPRPGTILPVVKEKKCIKILESNQESVKGLLNVTSTAQDNQTISTLKVSILRYFEMFMSSLQYHLAHVYQFKLNSVSCSFISISFLSNCINCWFISGMSCI